MTTQNDIDLLENQKLNVEVNDAKDVETQISLEVSKKIENSTKNSHSLKNNPDIYNIILIFFLYALQSVPSGLMRSISLILVSRKWSFADQGFLSFAFYPASLKLLWAPLVDSCKIPFFHKYGRRKSWIGLIQLSLGLVLILSANYLNIIIDIDRDRQKRDIYIMAVVFGLISIFSATHDIILDGWSIELLLKENVSWQATCNSIGMITGSFTGNTFFLLLESADFCNKNLRPLFGLSPQKYGLINIKIFFYIYGSIILLCCLLLMVLKNEKNLKKEDEDIKLFSVKNAYANIWKLLKKKPILKLIFILLTIRIGLSGESIYSLKLVEKGVSRENITIIGIFLSPLIIICPFLFNKYMHGPEPFNLLIKSYYLKLFMIIIISFFVFSTPFMREQDKSYPIYYYVIYFLLNVMNGVLSFMFWVSIGSFNSKIADISIGGTYLTFLNLWLGAGASLTRTSSLFLTSFLTFKKCSNIDTMLTNSKYQSTILPLVQLNATSETNKPLKICETSFDGYYLVASVSVFLGFLWIIFFRKLLKSLQNLPKSNWLIKN